MLPSSSGFYFIIMCILRLYDFQENARLSEKVLSLNRTVDEKNRTIELLRQQMVNLCRKLSLLFKMVLIFDSYRDM